MAGELNPSPVRASAQAVAEHGDCPWKEAVIDAAVVHWTLAKGHETDPRAAVNALLCEAQLEALDPAISKAAVDLIAAVEARGRQQAEQALELLQRKARDWNAEADKYLAQRDELTVQVATLTQALKDYRAEHKGCRSAVWGDNRCELCKQTDADLTGAQA